jgi:DNA end-binding protein Ku
MRAIWSGSLSFGLINIPVKIYSAAEEHALDLDMLDKDTLRPIGYARVIKGTNKVVKWENIVRGYKWHGGDYVVLDDADFKAANPKKTRSLDITSFADEAEIDTMYFERPYYLEPDKRSAKAYSLLREALRKSGKVAIALYVLRDKEHIGIIKPEGDILVLEQMRYHGDIRAAKGLDIPAGEQFSRKELEMAVQLVESLSEPFDASEYKDTYQEDLLKIIEAKAKGKKPGTRARAAPEEATEDVDDLLAILRESLGSRPGSRSSNGNGSKARKSSRSSNGSGPARSAAAAAKKPASKAAPKRAAAGRGGSTSAAAGRRGSSAAAGKASRGTKAAAGGRK